MCGGEWGEIRGRGRAAEQIFFEKVWAAKCSSNQHKEEERPSRDLPAPTLLVLFTLRMIQWENFTSPSKSLSTSDIWASFSLQQKWESKNWWGAAVCREGRKTAQTILIPTPHIEQVRLLFVYFSDVHVPFFFNFKSHQLKFISGLPNFFKVIFFG